MSAPIVVKRTGRRAPPPGERGAGAPPAGSPPGGRRPTKGGNDPWSSFSRRATGWAIAIAIFSFAIALVMGAFGERMVEPVTAKPSAFSWSAVGQRAMVKALKDAGVRTVVRRDPRHPAGGPDVTVIFDEPDLEAMKKQATDLSRLIDTAQQKGSAVVFVLPKWDGSVDDSHDPPWLASVSPAPTGEVQDVVDASRDPRLAALALTDAGDLDCETYGTAGRFHVRLPQAQLFDTASVVDAGMQRLVSCPEGTLVAEAGPLIAVSDPDLFDNQGIGEGDHAHLLAALVGPRTAVFDEAIHGFRLRFNLLSEMTRFPLVIATLHALLLLGVVLWAGMGRFGKPQPVAAARAAGSEALVANTAELLGAGGHTHVSLQSYWRDAMRAIAAHHNLPPEMPENEALASLSRIAGARGIEFPAGKIAVQVRGLGGGSKADERAVRLAVAIHRWRSEMTDAR